MYATAQTAATVAATAAPLGMAPIAPALSFMGAPLLRRRNPPARSMASALLAAGYSMASAQAWLNRQGRNALAGLPVSWPT